MLSEELRNKKFIERLYFMVKLLFWYLFSSVWFVNGLSCEVFSSGLYKLFILIKVKFFWRDMNLGMEYNYELKVGL